jgi:hypothetical protein
MLKFIACVALSFSLMGCAPSNPESKATQELNTAITLLPPKHIDLVPLGNQWYTFRLDTDNSGHYRKFLFRYWWGSHDELGCTCTELK